MLAFSTTPLPDLLASITALNWFGILLVYGMGLICTATILNLRRRTDLEEHEAHAIVFEIGARPAETDTRTQNVMAFLAAQLEDVAAAALPGARVAMAPGLLQLRRPRGCNALTWLRCLVALRRRAPGLAVLDGHKRLVAVLDFLPVHAAGPDGSAPALRPRRAALARAGIAHRCVVGGFYRSEIVAWLDGELARRPPARAA